MAYGTLHSASMGPSQMLLYNPTQLRVTTAAPLGKQLGDVGLYSDSLSPAQTKYSHRNHESPERLNGRESSTSLPEHFTGNDYCTVITVPQFTDDY